MAKFDVQIVELDALTLYGLGQPSSDKGQAKDIPTVSKRYYQTSGQRRESVLPFYVVSQGYEPQTTKFELFIGSEQPHDGLAQLTLPQGTYAKLAVRPKLGMLWGPAIGEAKGFLYGKWLPGSPYQARNLEYELHTEKSVGKKPEIDILFALE